jgi:hypothetical protein
MRASCCGAHCLHCFVQRAVLVTAAARACCGCATQRVSLDATGCRASILLAPPAQGTAGCERSGPARAAFVCGALRDLRMALRARGSDLIVRVGLPEEVLPQVGGQSSAGLAPRGVYGQGRSGMPPGLFWWVLRITVPVHASA